jgi:ketosteroid isomerase-like protein
MLTSSFARSLRRSLHLSVSTLLLAALGWTTLAVAGPAEDTKEATRLYQQGKLDQALTKINAALAQQPKDAQGRFIKGLILTEQKKPADAIQVFTSLTEDYPELPEPYNNLAVLYASQGNYDKAKAALELAIHTHPSYATAYENLGDIYAQLARRSYDKVLQLDKTNTTAQSKLAMVKDLFSPPKNTAVAAADPVKVAAATPPAKAESTKIATASAPKAEPAKSEPAKTTPTVKASGNADEQVRATVVAWAQAWAGKDVPGYLAFYAADFTPPDGLTRAAWEAQRKDRIERPKSISVEVKISKVTVKGDEATAVFRQAYRSDTTKSNNTKTLKLIKSGDKWLIRAERAGA